MLTESEEIRYNELKAKGESLTDEEKAELARLEEKKNQA